MRLPLALLTIAAAVTAAPAMAQDSQLEDFAQAMQDPFTQAQYAEIGAALVAVALQVPVAPLAEAVADLPGGERLPPVDPDARVADLVGPRGERVPAVVQRELPRVMGAMGAVAASLDATAPRLRAMAERLAHNYPRPR
ncbi:MAG: hypothetical protein KDE15_09415 [Erythrobacter sp.]|nr:hypothetical protein [Erythrobacter sp.]